MSYAGMGVLGAAPPKLRRGGAPLPPDAAAFAAQCLATATTAGQKAQCARAAKGLPPLTDAQMKEIDVTARATSTCFRRYKAGIGSGILGTPGWNECMAQERLNPGQAEASGKGGAGMSTNTKLMIGGGIVAAVVLGWVLLK